MKLKILCTPDFTAEELKELDQVSAQLGAPVEEVIRKAVSFFAAQCVPTQDGRDPKGRAA